MTGMLISLWRPSFMINGALSAKLWSKTWKLYASRPARASGVRPPSSGFQLKSLASSPRPLTFGLQSLASGLRPPAFGLLSLASGLRPLAFGVRPFSFRPPASLRAGREGGMHVEKIRSIEISISGCWCSAFLSKQFSPNIFCFSIRFFFPPHLQVAGAVTRLTVYRAISHFILRPEDFQPFVI